jgi:hypothetical protein
MEVAGGRGLRRIQVGVGVEIHEPNGLPEMALRAGHGPGYERAVAAQDDGESLGEGPGHLVGSRANGAGHTRGVALLRVLGVVA